MIYLQKMIPDYNRLLLLTLLETGVSTDNHLLTGLNQEA